jgi:hypothetical protein
MKNYNKVKNTCVSGEAACINYEGTVNTQSSLDSEDCWTIEETTQDVYNQLEEINLSALGNDCLNYVETTAGKTIVKNVLLKFEEEICNLKTEVETLNTEVTALKNKTACDILLGDCIDTLCLTDDCGASINNLGQLLQIMITKQCTI